LSKVDNSDLKDKIISQIEKYWWLNTHSVRT
jgi:hypothetical protein